MIGQECGASDEELNELLRRWRHLTGHRPHPPTAQASDPPESLAPCPPHRWPRSRRAPRHRAHVTMGGSAHPAPCSPGHGDAGRARPAGRGVERVGHDRRRRGTGGPRRGDHRYLLGDESAAGVVGRVRGDGEQQHRRDAVVHGSAACGCGTATPAGPTAAAAGPVRLDHARQAGRRCAPRRPARALHAGRHAGVGGAELAEGSPTPTARGPGRRTTWPIGTASSRLWPSAIGAGWRPTSCGLRHRPEVLLGLGRDAGGHDPAGGGDHPRRRSATPSWCAPRWGTCGAPTGQRLPAPVRRVGGYEHCDAAGVKLHQRPPPTRRRPSCELPARSTPPCTRPASTRRCGTRAPPTTSRCRARSTGRAPATTRCASTSSGCRPGVRPAADVLLQLGSARRSRWCCRRRGAAHGRGARGGAAAAVAGAGPDHGCGRACRRTARNVWQCEFTDEAEPPPDRSAGPTPAPRRPPRAPAPSAHRPRRHGHPAATRRPDPDHRDPGADHGVGGEPFPRPGGKSLVNTGMGVPTTTWDGAPLLTLGRHPGRW